METKNVLFGYRGKILSSFGFLKEIAVVDHREGQLRFTVELLKQFNPHVIAGLGFEKVSGGYALTGKT